MKIGIIHRKAEINRYSIEGVFKPLENLKDINKIELPCELQSIKDFFSLLWFSFKIKEKFIHITGDVHYMAFILFWKRKILTIHDLNHLESLKGLKRRLYSFIWFYLPIKFSNKIIVISPSTKIQLLRHFNFSRNKVDVIPNSFHSYKFYGHKQAQIDKFEILCVGSSYTKNLQSLVEAIKDLDGIKLKLIGRQSNILIESLEKNNINFVAKSNLSVEEMEIEFNDASMLYFVSIKEGFGLPILEAQSAGLPVLTSTTTSMPYVAGEGALLVNPHNVSEIRDSILKIKNDMDLSRLLRNKGFENVKRFSDENLIKAYISVYEKTFNLSINGN